MAKIEQILLVLMAFMLGLNGLYMLIDPMGWYDAVPGVSRTGPPNPHFIRDIGLMYLTSTGLIIYGLIRPDVRRLMVGISAIWITGHGLFHIWEWLAGVCTFDQFLTDAPGVLLPAAILIILTFLPKNKQEQ